MRMYHFALFFAIVGAVSGMVNYIIVDTDTSGTFGQGAPDMTVVDISESDVASLEMGDDRSTIEQLTDIGKYTGILWNVVKGVLLITAMLSSVFVWEIDGVNLFAPILVMFQVIIWVIYIFGGVQFITNRNTKGME